MSPATRAAMLAAWRAGEIRIALELAEDDITWPALLRRARRALDNEDPCARAIVGRLLAPFLP